MSVPDHRFIGFRFRRLPLLLLLRPCPSSWTSQGSSCRAGAPFVGLPEATSRDFHLHEDDTAGHTLAIAWCPLP